MHVGDEEPGRIAASRGAVPRRTLLRLGAMAGAAAALPWIGAARAGDEKPGGGRAEKKGPGVAPARGGGSAGAGDAAAFESKRRDAVRRAFAWLDGKIPGLVDGDGTPTKPFLVATTGLAKLVDARTVTGDDSLSRYRDATLRWLVRAERESADPARLPGVPGQFNSSDFIQYVWPAAMGGLFLAESVARDAAKEASLDGLRRALRILAAAQGADGGWGHHAFRPGTDAAPKTRELGGMKFAGGGYPATFVAPANCAAPVVGLSRALLGKDATPGVEAARRFYRDARLADGSFPYDASQRSATGSVTNAGRTAGAVFAECCLGAPRDAGHRRSVEYWLAHMGDTEEGHGSPCLNVVHGAFAGLALGAEVWTKYRDRVHPLIVSAQRDDGTLACICRKSGFGVTCDDERLAGAPVFADLNRACATSLLLLALVLDTGRLKLLEKLPPETATTPSAR
ncbi:MAG: hypothetical protein HMLKMBBP_02146 [Planctomycetes bacterium]|nr:hypothetical protein [Planctomycetota bacterium]